MVTYKKIDDRIFTEGKNLTNSEYRILTYLVFRFNENKGYAYPSIETIGKDTGIGKTTVNNTLNLLKKKGYITINKAKGRSGNNNTYSNLKYLVPNKTKQDVKSHENGKIEDEEKIAEQIDFVNENWQSQLIQNELGIELTNEQVVEVSTLKGVKLERAIEATKAQNQAKWNFNYLLKVYNNMNNAMNNNLGYNKVNKSDKVLRFQNYPQRKYTESDFEEMTNLNNWD